MVPLGITLGITIISIRPSQLLEMKEPSRHGYAQGIPNFVVVLVDTILLHRDLLANTLLRVAFTLLQRINICAAITSSSARRLG